MILFIISVQSYCNISKDLDFNSHTLKKSFNQNKIVRHIQEFFYQNLSEDKINDSCNGRDSFGNCNDQIEP